MSFLTEEQLDEIGKRAIVMQLAGCGNAQVLALLAHIAALTAENKRLKEELDNGTR